MCGIINQCLLNNKFPHAHSQCSMNASESKGANLIYLYLFSFMTGSSHFWICHLISRWDGHGYQTRLFTVNSSDWSANKAEGLFFFFFLNHTSVIQAVSLSANHRLFMCEDEWKRVTNGGTPTVQSLHRSRWKVLCQTPSRLIIKKIKKNQQWNPAVDWISIAQQGDQF